MMRKALLVLAVLPTLALAEAQQAQGGPAGRGPDPERAERRMRLARTVGLAEALDLDTAQALKLGDAMTRFDDRRKAVRKQAMDARDALRIAATGGAKPSAGDVDAAIGKLLDARAQMNALDKEMLGAVTQGLTPEQKARAALFLGRFRDRIERHMQMMRSGMGPGGDMGPGMMPGMRPGQGMRPGMGPGMDHDHDHMDRPPKETMMFHGGSDRLAQRPLVQDDDLDDAPPFDVDD